MSESDSKNLRGITQNCLRIYLDRVTADSKLPPGDLKRQVGESAISASFMTGMLFMAGLVDEIKDSEMNSDDIIKVLTELSGEFEYTFEDCRIDPA